MKVEEYIDLPADKQREVIKRLLAMASVEDLTDIEYARSEAEARHVFGMQHRVPEVIARLLAQIEVPRG